MNLPTAIVPAVTDPPDTTSCLAACVKNEGRYLLEWIAFHKVAGFNEIAIYDNASADGTFALLSPLAEREEIYLEQVPDRRKVAPQIDAYKREWRRPSQTEWLMFVDADEFVVLREPISINRFLASFPPEVSQVCLNWRVFGSGGMTEPSDDFVIERFLRASASSARPNNQGKSAARRQRIRRPWIHASEVIGPTVHDDGSPAEMKSLGITSRVSHVRAAIHHYILKSRAEFIAKMNRGIASQPVGSPKKIRGDREWYWQVHDLNDEFNDEALSRLAEVRREHDRLLAIVEAAGIGEIPIRPSRKSAARDFAMRPEGRRAARIAASVGALDEELRGRAAATGRLLESLSAAEAKHDSDRIGRLAADDAELLRLQRHLSRSSRRLRRQLRQLRTAGRKRSRPPAQGGNEAPAPRQ